MNCRKIFNAIVMVTGTSVGSGILGLPIITSSAGIIPAIIAFIIAWIFMLLAAYYILDIKMQLRGPYNLSSLIKLTLGRPGQYLSATMILLLLYALLCTYTMAGAAWLSIFVAPIIDLSKHTASIFFTLIFGGILLCGEKFTFNLNNLLGIGLVFAFIATVGSSLLPVSYDFVKQVNFIEILPSLPLILTTFGFSIVVPALTEYLDYDEQSVKIAMIIGSIIALVAYIVWEWATLGNISMNGVMGFHQMRQSGDNGTGVIVGLAASTHSTWVMFSGRLFAIFAVITSFLGVSLALLHFLADTLTLECGGKNRLLLFAVTYLPPILITSFYPKAFVQILSFAGIFVAVLLGLFPVLMVFKKRGFYKHYLNKSAVLLLLVALFFIMVITQEIVNLLR